MSMLSSSSTLAEIVAAYADNASYEEDSSASKAAAFITACRLLLLKIPKRTKHAGGSEIEVDPAQVREEMAAARNWSAANGGTSGSGGYRHASFENFRD